MALLVIQHHKNEPPAAFGDILRDHGHTLRVIAVYNGQPVPQDLDDVDGLVIMGGPQNVDETAKFPYLAAEMDYIKKAHTAGVPIVGICLGAQLIAKALGGEVAAMATPEVGWAPIKQAFPGTIDTIYQGIPWDTMQMHMHGQEVTKLPPGGTPLAGSKACKTQAFKVGLRTYGFQYHFEWREADIYLAAKDELVAKANASADTIVSGIAQHFDGYRRLGNRLSETIALMLLPVDKKR